MNKLYFYKDEIDYGFVYSSMRTPKELSVKIITGSDGYEKTLKELESLDNCIIISNYPCILNKFYSILTERHEVYFMLGNSPVHISHLTDKEIREVHNIENMFRNGGYGYDLGLF